MTVDGHKSPRIAISSAIADLITRGFTMPTSEHGAKSNRAMERFLEKFISQVWTIYEEKLKNLQLIDSPDCVKAAKLDCLEFISMKLDDWKRDATENQYFGIAHCQAAAVAGIGYGNRWIGRILEPLFLATLHRAEAAEFLTATDIDATPKKKNVAIVYGRDKDAHRCVREAIALCGLEPFDFPRAKVDQRDMHQATWSIVKHMLAQTTATVVILTPEEEAILREPYREYAQDAQYKNQPRPNVFLEYGMALVAHEEQNVLPITFGSAQLPSDLDFLNRNNWINCEGSEPGQSTIELMFKKFQAAGMNVVEQLDLDKARALHYSPPSMTAELGDPLAKLKDYIRSRDIESSSEINQVWSKVSEELYRSREPSESIRRGRAHGIATAGYWKLIEKRGEEILDAAAKLKIPFDPSTNSELRRLIEQHPYSAYIDWYDNPQICAAIGADGLVKQNLANSVANQNSMYWQRAIEKRRRHALLGE